MFWAGFALPLIFTYKQIETAGTCPNKQYQLKFICSSSHLWRVSKKGYTRKSVTPFFGSNTGYKSHKLYSFITSWSVRLYTLRHKKKKEKKTEKFKNIEHRLVHVINTVEGKFVKGEFLVMYQ